MSEIEKIKEDLEEEIRELDQKILDLEDEIAAKESYIEVLEGMVRESKDTNVKYANFIDSLGRALGIHRTSWFRGDPTSTILVEVEELKGYRNAGN